MEYQMVLVTPTYAAALLGANYEQNRHIRKNKVKELANAMSEGRFDNGNGQTIVIDKNGRLIDGQHRLSAIVESGKSFRMLVVTVDDGERAFATIDTGAPRKSGDALRANLGVANANKFAALSRAIVCIEQGHSPLPAALNGKFQGAVEADKALVYSFSKANLDRIKRILDTGTMMAVAYGAEGLTTPFALFVAIVEFVGRDDCLDDFVHEFSAMATRFEIIGYCKKTISNKRENSGARGLQREWVIGVLLQAYEMFRIGRFPAGQQGLNKGNTYIVNYSNYVEAQRAKDRGIQ